MVVSKIIKTGTGIFLLILSLVLSFSPYNPGIFGSPIHYSYGCILSTTDFERSYSYSIEEQAEWWCQHNILVSILILGVGIGGAVLLVLANKNALVRMKTAYKFSIIAIIAIVMLGATLLVWNNPDPYPSVSQNDMMCLTYWVVQHDGMVDNNMAETFLRGEIASFGQDYDVPDRTIWMKEIDGDITRIVVFGDWSYSLQSPNLTKSIAKIDGVEIIDEMVVECT